MQAAALRDISERLTVGAETEIEPEKHGEPVSISKHAITSITERLLAGKRIRRSLPIWGRLHVDRQLPFLIVYRRPPKQADPGTYRLVRGEASYLTAAGDRPLHASLVALTKAVASNMGSLFGGFLIIEIWAGPDEELTGEPADYKPGFRIFTTKAGAVSSTVDVLKKSLKRITAKQQSADVEIVAAAKISPPKLPALIAAKDTKKLGIHYLGLEIRPVYRDSPTENEFPLIRRAIHRGLAKALKQSVFEFVRSQTTQQPPNYQALGPRSFVKAAWDVDTQLAKASNQFDFLLCITPTNADAAWAAFRRKHFQIAPQFNYRPLPVEPALLKRFLFAARIERVEDPTLAQLFRAQQLELDRKITMLSERGTDRFKYGSLQLFGGVDDILHSAAEAILFQFPPRTRDESKGGTIDARAFAQRATLQINQYRKFYPDMPGQVLVREDVSGLLVSRGNLLVGDSVKTPISRVEALIAHEVGTHMVTFLNGRAQPFRQLYVGLPNYDELQEGLAVLAEYFVGGLSRPRLRLLAARVIAARAMTDGAGFVDVFRLLNDRHRFEQRTAFGVAMRTFRSGGFTKDAIYLRGLLRLLDYLKAGGDIELLYLGKYGFEHIPIIKELQWRKVLRTMQLRPHYLDNPETKQRLQLLRDGLTILDLVEKKK
jgi:uncharacterized protein (TIGR02421 family)